MPGKQGSSAGLKLLRDFGTVDTSYGLTPEQLCEKVKEADALIIRSATQVMTCVSHSPLSTAAKCRL